MRRSVLRKLLYGLIAALYVVSVPWYRAPGETTRLIGGLPDWVAVALGCYVGVAVLNAIAWLLTEIPDALPEPGAVSVAAEAERGRP
jgi:hypothetical protein